MKDLLKRIKHHEGFRSRVYKCTEGFDTIGYGFAIKDLEMDEDIALVHELDGKKYFFCCNGCRKIFVKKPKKYKKNV